MPAFSSNTPPPPGLTYLATVKPSLIYALIGAIFTSILLPILIALFFFSTRESRQNLTFRLNALAIILGIGEGVLLVSIQACSPRAVKLYYY